MPETPKTRADLLRFNIGALLAMGSGEDISLAQTFALASAIGPYLLELFTDRQKGRWLRLSFRDDPEGTIPYVTAPDGGPDGAYYDAAPKAETIALTAGAKRILRAYHARTAERGPDCWLPPNGATSAELGELQAAGLLRRADPPNTDCFALTDTGKAYRE